MFEACDGRRRRRRWLRQWRPHTAVIMRQEVVQTRTRKIRREIIEREKERNKEREWSML